MPLDTTVFYYPFRIRIQDSMIVILNLHDNGYSSQVFRYPQFSHVTSFGKQRGVSPINRNEPITEFKT